MHNLKNKFDIIAFRCILDMHNKNYKILFISIKYYSSLLITFFFFNKLCQFSLSIVAE